MIEQSIHQIAHSGFGCIGAIDLPQSLLDHDGLDIGELIVAPPRRDPVVQTTVVPIPRRIGFALRRYQSVPFPGNAR